MPKTEESSYPSWIVPAGCGAVGILALLVSGLIGYKIGLAQNPTAQFLKTIRDNVDKNLEDMPKFEPIKPLDSGEFFKNMPDSPLYKRDGKTK